MKAVEPSSSSMNDREARITLVCADWLLPILRAPIADGALAVCDNRIIDLGTAGKIQKKYSGAKLMQVPGAIMPGLINAHTHLELSFLSSVKPPAVHDTFVDWIRALLDRRAKENPVRHQILAAADKVLRQQKREGVIAIVDVGNASYVELDQADCADWPVVYRMLEVLAPQQSAVTGVLEELAAADGDTRITCHAPYSTAPEVLKAVKMRCRQHGHIYSIHTAESRDEYTFISENSGIFRKFLEDRQSWDGSFKETGAREEGTVQYFKRLGLLDDWTLLVHCVHLCGKEVDLIAETGAHVCLCPGSNQFLQVGKASVTEMIGKGILPALGTDSSASNESLCIWREMQLLAAQNVELPPEVILGMATLGGARALHMDDQYGSLEVGRVALFLSIQDDFARTARQGEELTAALVAGGMPADMQWLRVD